MQTELYTTQFFSPPNDRYADGNQAATQHA